MVSRRVKVKQLRKGRPQHVLVPTPALTTGATSSTPSLPLASGAQLLPTSPSANSVPTKKSHRYRHGDLKKTVMKIIALRVRGMTNVQIGETLGLTAGTINMYLYRAGKQGWLEEVTDDPQDSIEYGVMHKVVRNMGEALDSSDEERRDKMTVEVARGTIFKKFDPQNTQAPPSLTMLAVKIEMPMGASPETRAGAVVGTPAYLDGEVAES